MTSVETLMQAEINRLRKQISVLEDALTRVTYDKSFSCLKVEKTQQYVVDALKLSETSNAHNR